MHPSCRVRLNDAPCAQSLRRLLPAGPQLVTCDPCSTASKQHHPVQLLSSRSYRRRMFAIGECAGFPFRPWISNGFLREGQCAASLATPGISKGRCVGRAGGMCTSNGLMSRILVFCPLAFKGPTFRYKRPRIATFRIGSVQNQIGLCHVQATQPSQPQPRRRLASVSARVPSWRKPLA